MILSVEPGAAALLERLHRAGHRACQEDKSCSINNP